MIRLFSFICVFVFASHPASARSIMEGFWSGAVSVEIDRKTSHKAGGKRVVEAELTIASEYAHLRIEPDLIDGLVDTTCEYYFLHKEGRVGKIVLKPGAEGQICGDNPKIKLVRKDAETLFFTIQDSRMGLSETFPLDLRHGLVPEGVKSVIPENFNVMNIELGMLREAAEEQLLLRKYSYTSDGSVVYKGPGWKQRADLYVDGESKLYIMYSAISQDQEDFSREHVLLIGRHAVVHPSREITFPAFSNSVSLKYGPKDSGDLMRYYNYDGVLKPNSRAMLCEESNRQDVTVLYSRFKRFKGRTVIKPDCGSKAEIFATTSPKTGLVEAYEITLWNNDMLIENDWRKVAYQTVKNAELYLGRLSVDHVDIDL